MIQPFTSRELYIMNGGQKLYIYKDGFGDSYHAKAEEEMLWAKEVVDMALHKIATEENAITIQHAVDNLRYHKYEGIENLLVNSLPGASLKRQIALATALWKLSHYEKSFTIIFEIFKQDKTAYAYDVFMALFDFKDNTAAKRFVVSCLEENDADLFVKAQRVLSMWAWTGLPELRENKLLETLQFENKNLPSLQSAIDSVKQILNIDK